MNYPRQHRRRIHIEINLIFSTLGIGELTPIFSLAEANAKEDLLFYL